MTGQAGPDPALPLDDEHAEAVRLRHGLCAVLILRDKPAPRPEQGWWNEGDPAPERAGWQEGDPPPWGPVGPPADYEPECDTTEQPW